MAAVAANAPVAAGPADPPAGVLEAAAAPDETTSRACLPNGFIEVLFLRAGVVVSRIESSTPCDGGTPNRGGQVQGAVQSLVPGGLGGDLGRDFGLLPFPSPLNAIGIDDPDLRRAKREECERRLADLKAEVERLESLVDSGLRGQAAHAERVAAATQALDRAKAALAEADRAVELARLLRASAQRALNETDSPTNRQEADEALSATAEAGNHRFRVASDVANAERAVQLAVNTPVVADDFIALQRDNLAQAQQALASAEAECRDSGGLLDDGLGRVETAFAGLSLDLAGMLGRRPTLADDGFPEGGLLADDWSARAFAEAAGGRLEGRFDLGAWRRAAAAAGGDPAGPLVDPRLNAWVTAGVVFHEDSRSGLGQDGETVTVAAGGSYLVHPDLTLGLAGRFGHTDREGASGRTQADAHSLAAFAQARLPAGFDLSAMLAYTFVDIDARMVTGGVATSGSTDAESFAGQASLSRTFALGGWFVTPGAGASVVDIDTDGFTDSGGNVIPDSASTQISLNAGLSVGRSFAVDLDGGGVLILSPSFGFSGYYNVGRFDDLAGAAGGQEESDRFGLALSAGLGFGFANGITAGLSASATGLADDQTNVSLLGRLVIPF